jgi:hypothetical protein
LCQLISKSNTVAASLSSYTNPIDRFSLSQDDEGRVSGTIESGVKIHPFKTHSALTSTEDLNTLHSQSISLAKISKDTFWIGCQDSPRCLLEEYALRVFRHHTKDASYDRTLSGAEWWVQVKYDNNNTSTSYKDDPIPDIKMDTSIISMDTPTVSLNTSGPYKDVPISTDTLIPHIRIDESSTKTKTSSSGIDLHYDKDEEIAELFGIGVFPQISTVTYLSHNVNDIPTIVAENSISSPVESPIKHVFISQPRFGKHISFDGRYLHGAPKELKPVLSIAHDSDSISDSVALLEPRVTFLVNVWLNYRPVKTQSIPIDIISQLSSSSVSVANNMTGARIQYNRDETGVKLSDVTLLLSDMSDDSEYGHWVRIPFISEATAWGIGEHETGLYLKLWLPHDINNYWERRQNSSKSSSGKASKKISKTQTSLSSESVCPSSWRVVYPRSACASLEYETDEEFVDMMEEDLNI